MLHVGHDRAGGDSDRPVRITGDCRSTLCRRAPVISESAGEILAEDCMNVSLKIREYLEEVSASRRLFFTVPYPYLPECTMITGTVAFRTASRAVLPKKALNNAFLP